MPEAPYEIYAIKYGDRMGNRGGMFVHGDPHDAPMAMDYFIWVIRNDLRTIVIDVGYDKEEGEGRGRSFLRSPLEGLALLDIDAGAIEDVIITHLHYDHAGTLKDFPNARFHLQETEMQFTTGPWMLEDAERFAYSADHVAELIHCLFAKRVRFHQQDGEVAPGITVHRMSGHTMGMQSVRVRTRRGWVLLASDASHYYEHWVKRIPFSICWSQEALLSSYRQFEKLAESEDHVIPGHDPLVRQLYLPSLREAGDELVRLDLEPKQSLRALFS